MIVKDLKFQRSKISVYTGLNLFTKPKKVTKSSYYLQNKVCKNTTLVYSLIVTVDGPKKDLVMP